MLLTGSAKKIFFFFLNSPQKHVVSTPQKCLSKVPHWGTSDEYPTTYVSTDDDGLVFYVSFNITKSYWDNWRMIMKSSVQWSAIQFPSFGHCDSKFYVFVEKSKKIFILFVWKSFNTWSYEYCLVIFIVFGYYHLSRITLDALLSF